MYNEISAKKPVAFAEVYEIAQTLETTRYIADETAESSMSPSINNRVITTAICAFVGMVMMNVNSIYKVCNIQCKE